jgi:hypothetical protein
LQSGAAKTLVAMQTSNTVSTTLFTMCTSLCIGVLPVSFRFEAGQVSGPLANYQIFHIGDNGT